MAGCVLILLIVKRESDRAKGLQDGGKANLREENSWFRTRSRPVSENYKHYLQFWIDDFLADQLGDPVPSLDVEVHLAVVEKYHTYVGINITVVN